MCDPGTTQSPVWGPRRRSTRRASWTTEDSSCRCAGSHRAKCRSRIQVICSSSRRSTTTTPHSLFLPPIRVLKPMWKWSWLPTDRWKTARRSNRSPKEPTFLSFPSCKCYEPKTHQTKYKKTFFLLDPRNNTLGISIRSVIEYFKQWHGPP